MNKKMMNSLLLILTAFGLFAGCAPANKSTQQLSHQDDSKQSQILGGVISTADYQKQNGIVGLMMVFSDENGQQQGALCTGSLIKANIVLTAAHCLVLPPKSKLVAAIVFFHTDLDVVMKEVNSGDKTHYRLMTKVLRHEMYLKGQGADNDVGLIRFAGDAPEGFQLAHLPSASVSSSLRPGAQVTLSGYGVAKYEMTKDSAGKLSKPVGTGDGVLRQVAGIKVMGLSQDGNEIELDQSNGSGACHGDSGGPAYIADPVTNTTYLVGVTSRGEEPCNKTAVYSNVLGYEKWIESTSQKIMQ